MWTLHCMIFVHISVANKVLSLSLCFDSQPCSRIFLHGGLSLFLEGPTFFMDPWPTILYFNHWSELFVWLMTELIMPAKCPVKCPSRMSNVVPISWGPRRQQLRQTIDLMVQEWEKYGVGKSRSSYIGWMKPKHWGHCCPVVHQQRLVHHWVSVASWRQPVHTSPLMLYNTYLC